MFTFHIMSKERIGLDHDELGLWVMIIIPLLACSPTAEAQVFFDQSIDREWASIRKQCTLIEGVPLISKAAELSTQAVALSVLMSYHERELPILGPARPKRVQRLFTEGRFHGEPMMKSDTSAFETALYRSEDKSFRQFLTYARRHPTFTEGQVRAAALQETPTLHPTETLQQFAETRGQRVKIEQAVPRFSHIKSAIDHKLIGVLALNNHNALYPVVGYAGESQAVVIDPEEAKPSYRPASDILLTESDRKSHGAFARKVREYLQRIKVPVDMVTSCRAPRPPGLKLVNLEKLPQSRFYLITEWMVDLPQTIMKFRGEEDAATDR
jgi:hypothetical protein